MARCGDYLFVGTSKIRRRHTFGDLGLVSDREVFCGVTLLHLPAGAFVADLRYLRTCEEIYDVQVLPGLLGLHDDTYRRALSLPEQVFWEREREEEQKPGD